MTDAIKGRGALSQPPGPLRQTHADPRARRLVRRRAARQASRPSCCPKPARSIISRNKSPDIGFSQSINPYRGCEHGCIYCSSGDTPILMADGTTKAIADLKVGDAIYGTERIGWYRRYVKTRVFAHWSVIKPAYRVSLEDGTTLVTVRDHRLLTDRGWKFVTGSESGKARRPHLTVNNKLMGTGQFRDWRRDKDSRLQTRVSVRRYSRRWVGSLPITYEREGRAHGDQHRFRLALCDEEALESNSGLSSAISRSKRDTSFSRRRRVGRRLMNAIRHVRAHERRRSAAAGCVAGFPIARMARGLSRGNLRR